MIIVNPTILFILIMISLFMNVFLYCVAYKFLKAMESHKDKINEIVEYLNKDNNND